MVVVFGIAAPANRCEHISTQPRTTEPAPRPAGGAEGAVRFRLGLRFRAGVSGAAMHPMLEGDAAQLDRAFAHRAEAFGDADRLLVLGPDEARGAGQWKMSEQPVARRRRGLGREALVPEGLVER